MTIYPAKILTGILAGFLLADLRNDTSTTIRP